MRHQDLFDQHMQFLKPLGTFIRRREIGIIEEPLPENIKLQLLHMKKAERERGNVQGIVQ
jgi:hypothetical protein